MDKDKEELIELQNTFQKCADILKDAIKIVETMEQMNQGENKEKYKKLYDKLEEKLGLFMVQMIKISKFSY